jgi:hypothetical protein
MSQRLPPRPNLAHLKKQAKDVLRICQHRRPPWCLADAQHALARGYGFQSWRELKLHVESVTEQPATVRAGNSGEQPLKTAVENHRSLSSHPIVGTWIARSPVRSGDHRQTPMVDVVTAFGASDDLLTLTHIEADPAGHESAMKMVFPVDGQEHPVQFHDDLVLRATWTDSRALEIIARHGERIVYKATYEMSANGRSLIVSTPEQLTIFERVSSTRKCST